jgi:hypothetical protein
MSRIDWRGYHVRAVMPLLVALILLVVVFGGNSGTETASASTTASPVGQSANSCPLALGDQVKAIKAFAKMIPVFRHPRCSNCHGGVDPFADPRVGKHGGGQMDADAFEDGVCEDCHDQMSGGMPNSKWKLSPPPMHWVKKSDEELCMQVREMEPDAAKYVGHIRDDNGKEPFTLVAFKGMRALSAGTRSEVSGNEITKESPPGSLELMTQQAQEYIDAMGGSLVGSSECGCVLDKLEVRIHSTMTVVTPRVTSTITGDGSIGLKLRPDASPPTWDVASALRGDSAKITWSAVSISQPAGCDGHVVIKSSPATQFKFWLGMSATPDLKLSLQIIPGADLHQVLYRCLAPNGTWIELPKNDPVSLFSGAWNALHGKSAEAVALKATAAMDFNKLKAMDPKKLQAMTDAMKNNPDPAASAAQLKVFLNQMLPGASQLAAEAKNNFSFAIPDNSGCSLGTGTAFLARCDFDRTLTVPAGAGPSQTITEKTTITIGRAKP